VIVVYFYVYLYIILQHSHERESSVQALIRDIAQQFMDVDRNSEISIDCDRNYLIDFLNESNKPIVLLIDELNALEFL
jgi:type II secretory pathway predicted ATPase ExeA